MKRALVLLALVVACQTAPSATPSPVPPAGFGYSAEAPAARGGTLVVADWEVPDSLDPIHATTANDLRIASLVFAPLWGLGADLQPYPDLVREVPTVANGDIKPGRDGASMTVDVKLAPGRHWSDGTPITADDVIFTVNAICSADLPARDPSGFDHIAYQERKSATEVIWHFGPRPKGSCGLGADLTNGLYPAAALLGPRTRLLPAHRLASIPVRDWPSDPFFQHPDVASGPFGFRDAVAGRLVDLAANPHYGDGRVHGTWLDGITYRFYNGKAAMIAGLQAGEADLGFHLLPGDAADLNGIARSSTVTSASLQGEFLNPNHGNNAETGLPPPWVGDPALLTALAQAIDRQALNLAAFGGSAILTPGLFPAAMKDYATGATPTPRALDEARRTLDGDGWMAGADGVRVKAGRKLSFTLLTVCDSAPRQLEQAVLVRQWAEAGAAVSSGCKPRATFFGAYGKGGTNSTSAFDMSLYSNSWEPDPSAWGPFAVTSERPGANNPQGQNWNLCQDAGLDQAFFAGDTFLDPAKRRSAYLDAASEWIRYGCTIPLFEWPLVVQRPSRLHNFTPNPTLATDTWNAADWWLS